MVEIGKLNCLKVVKELDFEFSLDGDELGEILIPKRHIQRECVVGETVEVFIYLDSEDAVAATTKKPYAMVDNFAFLKVVSATPVGAFLDWGLEKDLLVPFREQKQRMVEGQSYVVFIYLDGKSNRLVASSQLNKFLDKTPGDFKEGASVALLICEQTQIGYKAIINGTHWGVLFESDIFQPIKKGQQVNGFIKKIRDDGKIDLCLQKPGYKKIGGLSEKIIEYLKKQGGFMPITNKSSPETIYKLFGVSKKSYKMGIGALYKRRVITIEKEGIKLVEGERYI